MADVHDERFAHDAFLVDQLVRPVANLYRVTPLAAGTAVGAPVAYVRQKRLAIKEDIRFFADEDQREELFRIKARSVFELGGRYDVTDAGGATIGVLEKVFGRSLLRSTWRLLDPAGAELATAEERSVPVAVLRRAIDFVPYVGDLVPIPYHFTIRSNGARLGELRRERSIRDRYTLDLGADAGRTIDRRLGIALAIALDALQSR